jgi:hypothetical protein
MKKSGQGRIFCGVCADYFCTWRRAALPSSTRALQVSLGREPDLGFAVCAAGAAPQRFLCVLFLAPRLQVRDRKTVFENRISAAKIQNIKHRFLCLICTFSISHNRFLKIDYR